MGRTVVPRFFRERFRQLKRIYLIYLWTIRRFRNKIICYFRRSGQEKDNWMQIGQIPIDKFYICIYSLILTGCIIIVMKRQEFNDMFLRRFEGRCQGRPLLKRYIKYFYKIYII